MAAAGAFGVGHVGGETVVAPARSGCLVSPTASSTGRARRSSPDPGRVRLAVETLTRMQAPAPHLDRRRSRLLVSRSRAAPRHGPVHSGAPVVGLDDDHGLLARVLHQRGHRPAERVGEPYERRQVGLPCAPSSATSAPLPTLRAPGERIQRQSPAAVRADRTLRATTSRAASCMAVIGLYRAVVEMTESARGFRAAGRARGRPGSTGAVRRVLHRRCVMPRSSSCCWVCSSSWPGRRGAWTSRRRSSWSPAAC